MGLHSLSEYTFTFLIMLLCVVTMWSLDVPSPGLPYHQM